MAEELDIIDLMDEDGNKLSFEHLLTFEVDEDFFVAMTPIEDMDDLKKDEVLIMKVEEDGDDDVYLPIESQEKLDALWDIFNEIYYADDEEEAEDEE